MTTAPGKLAGPLEAVEALQADGTIAMQSADLIRSHHERLLGTGFFEEVMLAAAGLPWMILCHWCLSACPTAMPSDQVRARMLCPVQA